MKQLAQLKPEEQKCQLLKGLQYRWPTNVKHVLNQKLHHAIWFKELNNQRHETVEKKKNKKKTLKTSFKYLTCIAKTWCCLHSKASQNSCNNSGPLQMSSA